MRSSSSSITLPPSGFLPVQMVANVGHVIDERVLSPDDESLMEGRQRVLRCSANADEVAALTLVVAHVSMGTGDNRFVVSAAHAVPGMNGYPLLDHE